MIFTGFALMLADVGFSAALVQKKDVSEDQTSTIFWLTLAVGFLLALFTLIIARWLAQFFESPALILIFRCIALNFVFGAFGSIPAALLQKQMKFRTIAKVETASMLLSGLLALGMALSGAGIWSLVVQSITASFLTAFGRCFSCKWVPKLIFRIDALKDLWGYSGHLYGFSFVNYWARSADNLVVGKFFGAAALGIYNRAYALMLLPISQINNGIISPVIFPALARIQDDRERVKRIYLRAVAMVALLLFPVLVGLSTVAEPFVLTLYGSKWLSVAPILRILALVGALQAIMNTSGWVYLSQSRTNTMFRMGAIFGVMAVCAFALGGAIGSIKALAICYAAANLLILYPCIAVSGRIIGVKFREVVQAVAMPALCSIIMAMAVMALHRWLFLNCLPWEKLLVLVISGSTVYGVMVVVLDLEAWTDFKTFLLRKKAID